jgi:hypothetical protein
VKLLLAVSISVWMAGGCLFGCTGTALAAESQHETQTVVVSQSCHAKHAKQREGVPSFAPAPRETTKDCPLVVSATAAISKNSGHLPDPGRAPVSALPLIEKTTVQSSTSLVVAYLPNRGPTHLRCCVFLI